jgi:hypothetical protein
LQGGDLGVLRRFPFPKGAMRWKLCAVISLALAGVTALAYDSSVNVEVRWRVLPYQSLTWVGPNDDPSLVSVSFPAPTEGDRERGYTESENVLRLHVASNVSWKVQLRFADSTDVSSLEVREGGDEYVALSTQPHVLAAGPYGVYDLELDLRRPLLRDGDAEAGAVQLIATIMPE